MLARARWTCATPGRRDVVPPRLPLDDGLLYVAESPSAQNACGFCRGCIYGRDGRLVASVAQEGLIRQR
ncbi:hypothetical protein [Xylophilus sp.]|uniref:hypothetical protein n=1 Tax=Xylophilus sp. TaxID=2653893 RepID=UPI002D7ED15F|nr:hypothetical protein [Xylophilus sp.]